ncbi:MAG: glutathione S-transferase family protein [Phaeovulum sp.]|uniref:glutathione S-transferase family protein n=1 Tax=Phaeovulum sp. TaxID=2934796 RepID=UPI00273262BD|nr:glutathione S-transferase family protein [Phaeovulum sp.]MDP3860088.1 glutathione S-transferase family protein [Phaeovulum sp.]
MLTMFHAPNSRSSRLYWLNEELGRPARVELVGVRRAMTQTGTPDPRNPHPEGKVPFLIHDGVAVWESTAIALYLTELFPEAGLGIAPGTPQRGRFLAWLAWYGAVLEPVIIAQLCGFSHPAWHASLRGLPEAVARLARHWQRHPYLMGDSFTAADLLAHSAFTWAPHMLPADPVVSAWVDRCHARPAAQATRAFDAAHMPPAS